MASIEFFPDAQVDGVVGEQTSNNDTLATIRGKPGDNANDSASAAWGVVLGASTTTDQWARINRSIYLFDTSSLGAGETIVSATFSFNIRDIADNIRDGLSGAASANSVVVLVASTPISNTALATADYLNVDYEGDVAAVDFGRSVQQDSMAVGYNDITLNANGRNHINKTGISKFGNLYGWDFNNTVTGLTWTSGENNHLYLYYSEAGGTTVDPRLVVVTPSAGPANLKTADTVVVANIKTRNSIAIGSIKTWNTVT